MRLINTTTRELKEFIGRNIPKYAILSHTWEEEEVSYQDYIDGKHLTLQMKGFAKIDMTCKLAVKDGIEYAWVDTCCIDKRSSAELTEAINSMFRWYERAQVCYAFLSDLDDGLEGDDMESALRECRWFTRGWTLQELIAPKVMWFFSSGWSYIGSKTSLRSLSDITGIQIDILEKRTPLSSIMVAKKMTWASSRVTTRIEDTAYCLLGIFNVNMPLLYGEEEKAFRRLQEEIIRTTPDLSIFGWIMREFEEYRNPVIPTYCGVLAEAPSYFAGCIDLPTSMNNSNVEFSVTNNGVRLTSAVLACFGLGNSAVSYALPLSTANDGFKGPSVLLRKVGPNRFLRSDPWRLFHHPNHSRTTVLHDIHYLLLAPPDQDCQNFYQNMSGLRLEWIGRELLELDRSNKLRLVLAHDMTIGVVVPHSLFDYEERVFFLPRGSGELESWGILRFDCPGQGGPAYRPSVIQCVFIFTILRHMVSQFSLVAYDKHALQIEDVKSKAAAQHYSAASLLHALRERKIPRTSSICVKHPSTKLATVVKFKTAVERILDSWQGTITFSYQVYNTKDVPVMAQDAKWVLLDERGAI